MQGRQKHLLPVSCTGISWRCQVFGKMKKMLKILEQKSRDSRD